MCSEPVRTDRPIDTVCSEVQEMASDTAVEKFLKYSLHWRRSLMTTRLQISCFLDESRPMVKFLAAWWFLNLVMNFTVPGLQPFSAALLLPSCEIFILMAVTAAAVRWGMPFHALYYFPAIAVVSRREEEVEIDPALYEMPFPEPMQPF